MKRLFYALLGLAGFTLFVLGALQVWFYTFKVSDPEKAARIEAEAVEKLRARDQRAANPETNRFLKFQTMFYARPDSPQAERDLALPFQAFQDYSPALTDKPVDFAGLLTHPPPVFTTALEKYQANLPRLEELLTSPELHWPSRYDDGPDGRLPNLVLLRTIYQSLSGYVDYLLARHKTDQALHYALLGLTSSHKWLDNGGFFGGVISQLLHRVALSSVLRVATSGQLSAAQLRQVLAAVEQSAIPPGFLLERMDEEFAMQMKAVDALESGHVQDATYRDLGRLGWIPGYLERERRILQQFYLEDRQVMESGQEFPSGQPSSRARIRSAYPLVVETLYVWPAKAYDVIRLAMDYDRAARIVVALQLYRLDHKAYPEKLEELVPAYLPQLPRDLMVADGKFVYARKDKSFKLESAYSKPDLRASYSEFFPVQD